MMVLMVILIPLFILFFRPLDDFLLLIFVGFWMENANDVDILKYWKLFVGIEPTGTKCSKPLATSRIGIV